MLRFRFLTGDINWQTYGGKWISKKLNNGNFDYWLVIEVINWIEATGDKTNGTYNVSLSSVSPSEAGEENLTAAFRCCGLENAEYAEQRKNPIAQVECLDSYGIKAPLWQASGNNIHKLLKECRKQAELSCSLYGFYMDGPKNRIGTTGWECQRGDLNSALHRI